MSANSTLTRTARTPAGAGSLEEPWWGWVVALVLGIVAAVCYGNSLSAPFIFDDVPAIEQNASLRGLRQASELVAPATVRGSGVVGRPLVNLSLAANRWLGGDDVRGYHAFNILVHLGAALVLWGVVRRTVMRVGAGGPPVSDGNAGRATRSSTTAAFAVALLWLVHPLQTESVTCVIQRTESLLGLFFLLTFYCFIRGVEATSRRWPWQVATVAAALAGAATKEVMATAPVLLLLYDRTFVGRSFRTAWHARWRIYAALLSTWVVVAWSLWQSDVRGGTVGFGHGVTAWDYALTQCRAVTIYLKLALWPHPLVLDYGTAVVRDWRDVWPQGLFLLALVSGAIWALLRRPVLGFLGAWFFIILAPSSSFVPLVTQTVAEHRMYLPLVAIVVGLVGMLERAAAPLARAIVAMVALGWGMTTIARNAVYRSDESIWRDTLGKIPTNGRAHRALAEIADRDGRSAEAIAFGEAGARLEPDDPIAHFNLAFSLAKASRLDEAIEQYRAAARLNPKATEAHINLGVLLARRGRLDEAIAECELVVRLDPNSPEDWFNLGALFYRTGRFADAAGQFERAVALRPGFAAAWHRLGNSRVKLQEFDAAVAAYRESVRFAADNYEVQINLAGALLKLGRPAEAVPALEAALRLHPGDPIATANLAAARDAAGR